MSIMHMFHVSIITPSLMKIPFHYSGAPGAHGVCLPDATEAVGQAGANVLGTADSIGAT